MTVLQLLVKKSVEKFVLENVAKKNRKQKPSVEKETKRLALNERQRYQEVLETRDKTGQLNFNEMRNKGQNLI